MSEDFCSWFPNQFAALLFIFIFFLWAASELFNTLGFHRSQPIPGLQRSDRWSYWIIFAVVWGSMLVSLLLRSRNLGIFHNDFQFIDLLPLVRSIEAIDSLTPMLELAGYQAWGEYGLAGRRYFTKDRGVYRTHNAHIYQVNDPEIDRHLAFCAYLRSHPKTRDEYATLKREVYARHPDDIAAYNDAKNDWIKAVEAMALEWYRQQVR